MNYQCNDKIHYKYSGQTECFQSWRLIMKIICLFSLILLTAVAGEAGHNAEDNGIAKSCYFESDVVMSWNEAAEEYYFVNPKL